MRVLILPFVLCYNETIVKITIISVGAKPKPETEYLINDFLKRLPRSIDVVWRYIKHSNGEPAISKLKEAESILRAIPDEAKVILLDEKGQQLTSPQLANKVFHNPKNIVFVIGGAYGVTKSVKDRSDFVWSLGSLVFPHQLVRVILAEQLYRAHSISTGHPYHHG